MRLIFFHFAIDSFSVSMTSILTNMFNLATTDLGDCFRMLFQVMKFEDLKELGSESAVKV